MTLFLFKLLLKFTKLTHQRSRMRRDGYKIAWLILNVLIYLIPGIAIFMLLPAWILFAIEDNWNYLDSFYYTFITLSTIGFGDYVAGEEVLMSSYWVSWIKFCSNSPAFDSQLSSNLLVISLPYSRTISNFKLPVRYGLYFYKCSFNATFIKLNKPFAYELEATEQKRVPHISCFLITCNFTFLFFNVYLHCSVTLSGKYIYHFLLLCSDAWVFLDWNLVFYLWPFRSWFYYLTDICLDTWHELYSFDWLLEMFLSFAFTQESWNWFNNLVWGYG